MFRSAAPPCRSALACASASEPGYIVNQAALLMYSVFANTNEKPESE